MKKETIIKILKTLLLEYRECKIVNEEKDIDWDAPSFIVDVADTYIYIYIDIDNNILIYDNEFNMLSITFNIFFQDEIEKAVWLTKELILIQSEIEEEKEENENI